LVYSDGETASTSRTTSEALLLLGHEPELIRHPAERRQRAVYGAIDMPWAKLVGQIAQAYGKQAVRRRTSVWAGPWKSRTPV